MLVRNTQQMGAGLVMLGGRGELRRRRLDRHGAGKGHAGRFPDPQRGSGPPRRLVLLMHASEIAQGNGIQKQIAKEAIKTLNAQDYCGVMQWIGNEVWIYGQGPVEIGQYRNKLLAAVDRMSPRRHARLRAGHAPGRAGFPQPAKQAGGGEAHDRAQRRRPRGAAAGDDRPAEGHGRDDLHGGRQRPRHGRKSESRQHRHRRQRQVLLREQPQQGPAADLPEGGPPRLPVARLRAAQSRFP